MTNRKRTTRSAAVTMRDVAELAHVSQSTVSRVLSQATAPIPIGPETQQRVLAAVKQLGYHPNLHAGSLRGQKTRMVAMMIADIANPFYHPMVRAVQDIAHQHRYDVLVANSDHTRENELLFCEAMIRRPVDGIIMVPYHLGEADIDDLITRTGAAVVVLASHLQHPLIDRVTCNDDEATYSAIRWLIEQKQHQRIGVIRVSQSYAVGVRRQNAFLRAIADTGLHLPSEYIQEGDWSVESGQQAMAAFLQLPQPPTAVFACNDHMAIGAMLTAQAAQFRIPQDIAIVGFDDIPAASWVSPRLTTIAQYPSEIGYYLAQAAFERIEGRAVGPARRYAVPCRLIEREST